MTRWQHTAHLSMGMLPFVPLCFYEMKEPNFVLVHAGESGCAAENVQQCTAGLELTPV